MSAKKTNAPDRLWEYLLVIWWLLTVVLAGFAIVYTATAAGFAYGVGAGVITIAVMFIVRAVVNIMTNGQFNEKRYL
jgi:putative membrane protein (TIGR04086 family)